MPWLHLPVLADYREPPGHVPANISTDVHRRRGFVRPSVLPSYTTNSHSGPHYDALALPCQRSAVTRRTTREGTRPLGECVARHGSCEGTTADWLAEEQRSLPTAVWYDERRRVHTRSCRGGTRTSPTGTMWRRPRSSLEGITL